VSSVCYLFFSSRRRHTISKRDWSSDVCSSDLQHDADVGVSAATLAELMRRGGHSDIRVVLRYQHATMARDRELADRTSKRAAARSEERRGGKEGGSGVGKK